MTGHTSSLFSSFSKRLGLAQLINSIFSTPLLFGFLCFLIYNANLRLIASGDTLPARYLPLIILHEGTLKLDTSARLVASGHGRLITAKEIAAKEAAGVREKVRSFEPWTYWMVRSRNKELISLYPVVTPILVAPLYIPAVLYLNSKGWEQPQIGQIGELMEKLSASLLASAAAVIMLIILRRERNPWSLLLALGFALGTNTWTISSQALWQHGTGELLIALALLLATSPPSTFRSLLIGAVCALIAGNRPPDAFIAIAIGVYYLWCRRREVPWLIAGAVIPSAAILYYNLGVAGHFAGAYALAARPDRFFHFGITGIAGLLLSPARGLLVFTPFLIFIPLGAMQRIRGSSSEERRLAIVFIAAICAQILLYAQADWRAGVSWGPRWLTDPLPLLLWLLAPAPLAMKTLSRSVFIVLLIASVAIQSVGAFWYTKTSDEGIFSESQTFGSGAWNFGNIPYLSELQHPPAGAELIHPVRGFLDAVGSSRVSGPGVLLSLKSGDQIEGWTLAGNRSPAQVVALIDGVVVGMTYSFFPRPDVDSTFHSSSPSGWRMSAELTGVEPGQRILQLAARIHPRSEFLIFREQSITVVSPDEPKQPSVDSKASLSESDLSRLAARASFLLREHQKESGAWLTSFTPERQYSTHRQELNTFSTSMIVDILSPVAAKHGLSEQLERARNHLENQIEDNGLVRYHGLPTGPHIGTLGCAITPDSDDTALVWRIASRGSNRKKFAEDPRRILMLEELTRYRDARGLYSTWLAPRAQYQCLDPGPNPNPTEVTIQLHIFLMLHDLGLPAAEQLCASLKSSISDENNWVYYAKAPIIPYLRIWEMQSNNCNLPLPTNRLSLTGAEQEIWSEAVRQLTQESESASPEERRKSAVDLLIGLASSDFEKIRLSPPLLYHNDLSATVKRYYWSEDFGYALWLRLYEGMSSPSQPPAR